MIERLGKCIICLIAIPILWCALVAVGVLILLLPLLALVCPQAISIGESKT